MRENGGKATLVANFGFRAEPSEKKRGYYLFYHLWRVGNAAPIVKWAITSAAVGANYIMLCLECIIV